MFESTWDLVKIKAGFERFIKEHGRLPTAREIDKIKYLPASRTIQRGFGGLEKLRLELGYAVVHFGKGESRSIVAKMANVRGSKAEEGIYKLLAAKFGEMFVHIEKPFGTSSKQRLDFFVYSPSGDFGVDVFFPKDLDSMVRSINIKAHIYSAYNKTLYFIVANPTITQNEVGFLIERKRDLLNPKVKVVTIKSFQSIIEPMRHYSAIQAE